MKDEKQQEEINDVYVRLFSFIKLLNDDRRFFRIQTERATYIYDCNTHCISRLQKKYGEFLEVETFSALEKIISSISHDECKEILSRYHEIFSQVLKKSIIQPLHQGELKLSLSTSCNLDCIYCFRAKTKIQKTNPQIAKDAIDYFTSLLSG
jgi:sulfatase maturation enzyme AslB (radical SAM superfamily)